MVSEEEEDKTKERRRSKIPKARRQTSEPEARPKTLVNLESKWLNSATNKARERKVFVDECLVTMEVESTSKALQPHEMEAFSVEEISKALVMHNGCQDLKIPDCSLKDTTYCVEAMNTVTDKAQSVEAKTECPNNVKSREIQMKSSKSTDNSPRKSHLVRSKNVSPHSGLKFQRNPNKKLISKPFELHSILKPMGRSNTEPACSSGEFKGTPEGAKMIPIREIHKFSTATLPEPQENSPRSSEESDNSRVTDSKKLTMNKCLGSSEAESTPKEVKALSIEKISKKIVRQFNSENLKSPDNPMKDIECGMGAMNVTANKTIIEDVNTKDLKTPSVRPKMISAHSGLTFKANTAKKTIPKPFKLHSNSKPMRRSKTLPTSSSAKCNGAPDNARNASGKEVHAQFKKGSQITRGNTLGAAEKPNSPEESGSNSMSFKKSSAFGGMVFIRKRNTTQVQTKVFDNGPKNIKN